MTTNVEMTKIFEDQRQQYNRVQPMSLATRLTTLDQLERLLRENLNAFVEALQADFGQRDPLQIIGADLTGPLTTIAYTRKHLRKWMKPDKKRLGLMGLSGSREYIYNEPLGVVGIMSPFNAPIDLALDPAIEAIAAGNRVMVKISEYTPKAAALLQKLAKKYVSETTFAVITGEADVSAHFSALNWDKFVFTGGSETGKKILAAAAPNLTPVVLELGGKNPAVVLPDANQQLAAEKIARGRSGNSGQICLDVDYAMVPANQLTDYIHLIVEQLEQAFPTYSDNPEYSAIINDAAYKRITGMLAEAQQRGTQLLTINPNHDAVPDATKRLIPLTLAINPDPDLQIAKNEIFGPILSIFTYETLDEAIAFINTHEKSLAMYVFGKNKAQLNRIIRHTSSGGVDINELALHAGSHEMGFGGVGYSGMGRYKGGKVGFETFSNPKSVYKQGILAKYTTRFMVPIHNQRNEKRFKKMLGL
ncbi:aldehyde dehydrogenase family protein [Levilactobacillus brevis]|uniref:aldehyde dehydrogenase family protein n=1 Tax=Levilactobacillus brevis TaxID=1580 RepID=UPI00325ACB1D